jgi:hypothetical protein
MIKPNGTIVRSIVNTGADGKASFVYRFNKKTDPAGRYVVNTDAALNGVGGNASTGFDVR